MSEAEAQSFREAQRLGGFVTAPAVAERWVPKGFVVIGFNVRASNQATFPAQVHDVKAAIRHLRANAAAYGIDPGRIAAMGTSSGGWVAAMAGVTAGIAGLEAGAVQKADPAGYVSAGSPPIFICHGMQDPLVPCHQSELLFSAYEKAGATATLALVPEAGHTGAYLQAEEDSLGRTILQTSGGVTTRGSSPAPTYETLLSFLRDTLGA